MGMINDKLQKFSYGGIIGEQAGYLSEKILEAAHEAVGDLQKDGWTLDEIAEYANKAIESELEASTPYYSHIALYSSIADVAITRNIFGE